MRKKSLLILIISLLAILSSCKKEVKVDEFITEVDSNAKNTINCLYKFKTLSDIQKNLSDLEKYTTPTFYRNHNDINAYRKYEGYTQTVDIKVVVSERTSTGAKGVAVVKIIATNEILNQFEIDLKSFYFETTTDGKIDKLSEIID